MAVHAEMVWVREAGSVHKALPRTAVQLESYWSCQKRM